MNGLTKDRTSSIGNDHYSILEEAMDEKTRTHKLVKVTLVVAVAALIIWIGFTLGYGLGLEDGADSVFCSPRIFNF